MNIYDRIFKENIEPLIPFLFEKVLHLYDVRKTEELKDKLQITLERETDYIRKVVFDGEAWRNYILQIEIQTTDDLEMVFRMILYYSILCYKYRLPVKQFVLYLGDKQPPSMATVLSHENLFYKFTLIDIRTIGYEHFLNSQQPEEVILAILGDMHGKAPEVVINEILLKLQSFEQNGLKMGKYFIQLRVISKLRKLQKLTFELIKKMPFIYELETDEAYLEGLNIGEARGEARGEAKGEIRGEARGMTKVQHDTVVRMLKSQKFSIEDIVLAAGVTISFVKKLQKELGKDNK